MKLLIVEQEQQLLTELSSFLKKEDCQVTALPLAKASEKIKSSEFDCVIISIGKETEIELQLVEQLNNENRTDGVIIISENNSLEFMVRCFDLGADDFVETPFQIPALYARLKAVIRRKKFNAKSKLYFANLVIDFYLKKVYVWDKAINLTKKEYEILLHLIANKNSSITKESIAEYVWGEYLKKIDSYDFLFAHIKNLKNKLKIAKAELVIKNIYGVGYQIEEL
ncbi:MAG: response regulator transcription factor [Bacteroidia bacterium]|nr:response regulator transcription factor [Bacteroidia bacterium]